MNAHRWQQIEKLFHAALERPSGEREAFLAQACGGDGELQSEVQALMRQSETHLSGGHADAETATVVTFPAETTRLTPGMRLGPYLIHSMLGSGGMGEVYKAVDTRLGRSVAIKTSHQRFSARFGREARTISSLNHPNICTLHDIGPNYLVTELVEGETLRDRLKRNRTEENGVEIARQILEALRAAHRAGIVHRDLKPANVMVRSDGYVKVLDFGLAKRMTEPGVGHAESFELSRPGQVLGTVPYMSPEQILGQETDPRSDLFSFGIMLFEMMTGQHPWPRKTSIDLMQAILREALPATAATTTLSPSMSALIAKLLNKNPEERFASADAVLSALAATTAAASDTSAKPLNSIAVLPFVFLTTVEESRSLSLGFADALITVLASLEDVRVLPTSAVLNYVAGSDPGQICRDLGVRQVLQANVQRMGGQWRVSVQLFDSAVGRSTFSEKYDFKLESVFDVQDEICRRVLASIQSKFSAAPSNARTRYSAIPEAYEAFMSGLRDSYSNQADVLSNAIQSLLTAVEIDPDFALAHATLSYSCMNMHFNFDSQYAWVQKAEHHCREALRLDPSLPEGHMAQSWVLWSPAKGFQHVEAMTALEPVLAAQPNFERAHNRMASICLHIGRLEEGRIAHEHAQRSNPKTMSNNLEDYFLYSGQFQQLAEVAEAHLNERPRSPKELLYHALAPLYMGDFAQAEARLAQARQHFPDEPYIISLQGILHAKMNQPESALECVRLALDSPKSLGHTHHTHHHIACVYAILGQMDKAMAWLDRTVNNGFPCWSFFRIDPHLENLRGHVEFEKLLADLERKYSAIEIRRL